MQNVDKVRVAEEARWRPGCFFGGSTVILVGLLVLFLARLAPNLSVGPPVYESVARVMVSGKSLSTPDARVRLDVEVIKSDALLKEAMAHGKLEKRPSFRSGRGAPLKALTVEKEGDLPIVSISVRSSRADDARAGADAVTKTYLKLFEKRTNNSADEMKFIITEAVTDLANDLRALERALEEAEMGLAKIGHRPEQLAELEKTVLALETKAAGTEARLGALKSAIESSTSDAETQLILQRILSLSEPPPGEAAIRGLKADVDAARAELKAIIQLRDAEAARGKAAAKHETRVANLAAEIERKKAMHRELIQRLKDIQLKGNNEGLSATVLSPASVATEVVDF